MVARLRNETRIVWDAQVAHLTNNEFIKSEQLHHLLRQILFFYRPTELDNKRLDSMTQLIWSNIKTFGKEQGENN